MFGYIPALVYRVRLAPHARVIQRMRMGVEKDIERRRRKEENRGLLEEQIALRHRLEQRDEKK